SKACLLAVGHLHDRPSVIAAREIGYPRWIARCRSNTVPQRMSGCSDAFERAPMTVLLAGLGLLFISFCVQLVLWRIFVPGRQIRALLVIFFLVPLIVFGVVQIAGIVLVTLSAAEIVRLAVFYVSCGLMYIVLYSAIEEQSPTLAIISY